MSPQRREESSEVSQRNSAPPYWILHFVQNDNLGLEALLEAGTKISSAVWTKLMLVVLVAAVVVGPLRSEEKAGLQTVSRVTAGELERLARTEMESRKIPGLAVAVVRDGQVAWTGFYGMADLENSIPVGEQTVFRFASVSKAITAVAALRLVEAGKLSLDAPVAKLIGAGEGTFDGAMTVRHLLSHQSGLRHYQERASRVPLTHYNRLADVLRAKAGEAALFAPGTQFGYTTHGYVVLGRVMEIASGGEFAGLMRDEIFSSAGMKMARVDDWYELIPHRAQGYFRGLNGEVRNSEPADLSDKIPGGGLCGTLGDLAAFAVAVQSRALLTPAMTAEMWKPQRLIDGTVTRYGLGWYVEEVGGRREVYHPGSQARVSSLVWLSPEENVAVAILGNLEQVDFLALARRLGAAVRAEVR